MSVVNRVISETPIIYRPALRKVLGSVESALFLNQVYWRWTHHGTFYKFDGPCGHAMYKPGDSWFEELGFSERELRRVKKELCHKVPPSQMESDEFDTDKPIVYSIDSGRVTRYRINQRAYDAIIAKAYGGDDELIDETSDSIANRQNVDYLIDKTSITNAETTRDYIDTNVSIVSPPEKPKKKNGDEATPKRNIRHEYQDAMFQAFTESSSSPIPRFDTKSQIAANLHSWVNPVWEIYNLYDTLYDTTYDDERLARVCALIKQAVKRNLANSLTTVRPAGIVSSARELFAERYGNQTSPQESQVVNSQYVTVSGVVE